MEKFEKKVWLATPTMHGDEMKYVNQAYETNWMSTVGENINEVERIAAEKAGADYIGVGAVFGTSTKKNARNMSIDGLKEIVESVQIPVVAIGGINAENLMELAGSKIDGIAVVSAIFAAKDPGAATKNLLLKAKELVNGNE